MKIEIKTKMWEEKPAEITKMLCWFTITMSVVTVLATMWEKNWIIMVTNATMVMTCAVIVASYNEWQQEKEKKSDKK